MIESSTYCISISDHYLRILNINIILTYLSSSFIVVQIHRCPSCSWRIFLDIGRTNFFRSINKPACELYSILQIITSKRSIIFKIIFLVCSLYYSASLQRCIENRVMSFLDGTFFGEVWSPSLIFSLICIIEFGKFRLINIKIKHYQGLQTILIRDWTHKKTIIVIYQNFSNNYLVR